MLVQHEVWFYRAGLVWLSLLGLIGLGTALYFALWPTLIGAGALTVLFLTIAAAACVGDGNPAKKAKEREVRLESERNHVW